MRAILLLLILLGAGCGCASIPSHQSLRSTALRLEFVGGLCSGTAIASDKLLTATHCWKYGKLLKVNGTQVELVRATEDKKDHSVATIVGLNFNSWAKFGAIPKQGDRVRFFGNPKGNADVYREGYVAHVNEKVIAVSMMVCLGDSGAGIFNDSGELVGMVSAVTVDSCLFGLAFRS